MRIALVILALAIGCGGRNPTLTDKQFMVLDVLYRQHRRYLGNDGNQWVPESEILSRSGVDSVSVKYLLDKMDGHNEWRVVIQNIRGNRRARIYDVEMYEAIRDERNQRIRQENFTLTVALLGLFCSALGGALGASLANPLRNLLLSLWRRLKDTKSFKSAKNGGRQESRKESAKETADTEPEDAQGPPPDSDES